MLGIKLNINVKMIIINYDLKIFISDDCKLFTVKLTATEKTNNQPFW